MITALNKTIGQITDEIRDNSVEAVERLTRKQLVELITQLIESKDIHRLCSMDDPYGQLVYIPGRQTEELKAKVEKLETQLTTDRINKNIEPSPERLRRRITNLERLNESLRQVISSLTDPMKHNTQLMETIYSQQERISDLLEERNRLFQQNIELNVWKQNHQK